VLAAQAGSAVLVTALTGALAPVGVAALVLAACARPWRGREAAASPAGPPLALGLGFLAGFVATHGLPRLAGASLRDELAWSALALAGLAALRARRGALPLLLQGLVSALLPWFLLDFQRTRHWERLEGVLWSAALALVLFLSWTLLGAHEQRRARPAAVLGWTTMTALAAGAYVLSGSVQIAQLAGALAAALGTCAALALWRRAAGLGPAGVAPFIVLHLGLTWCGRFISELSLAGFVLLALAPLGVLAGRAVPASRARLAAGVEGLVPPLIALVALLLERAAATASSSSSYPY